MELLVGCDSVEAYGEKLGFCSLCGTGTINKHLAAKIT